MYYSRPLFLYFRLFNTVFKPQLRVNKFVNDWIRTADLWCRSDCSTPCATTACDEINIFCAE